MGKEGRSKALVVISKQPMDPGKMTRKREKAWNIVYVSGLPSRPGTDAHGVHPLEGTLMPWTGYSTPSKGHTEYKKGVAKGAKIR